MRASTATIASPKSPSSSSSPTTTTTTTTTTVRNRPQKRDSDSSTTKRLTRIATVHTVAISISSPVRAARDHKALDRRDIPGFDLLESGEAKVGSGNQLHLLSDVTTPASAASHVTETEHSEVKTEKEDTPTTPVQERDVVEVQGTEAGPLGGPFAVHSQDEASDARQAHGDDAAGASPARRAASEEKWLPEPEQGEDDDERELVGAAKTGGETEVSRAEERVSQPAEVLTAGWEKSGGQHGQAKEQQQHASHRGDDVPAGSTTLRDEEEPPSKSVGQDQSTNMTHSSDEVSVPKTSGGGTAKGGEIDAEIQTAGHLSTTGVRLKRAGRIKAAELRFRRALDIYEAKAGRNGDVRIGYMLHELGLCVSEAGRKIRGARLLKRALDIKEAKLGWGHLQVAYTLHELGMCVGEAGRRDDAERYFRRALSIYDNSTGPEDVRLSKAHVLHQLGVCLGQGFRKEEAVRVLTTALEVREAVSDTEDLGVASTLHELGLALWEVNEQEDAEEHLTRALRIKEASLGPDDLQVAATLHELAACAGESGRYSRATDLFTRALEIRESELGPDDPATRDTHQEMDRCLDEMEVERNRVGSFMQYMLSSVCRMYIPVV